VRYAAVACDINSGEEVVLDRGDVAFAVRSSCAVPGVFTPVISEDGRMLIDGGVLNPLPANVVKAMGADMVMGVDVLACGASFRNTPKTALGMLFQSAMIVFRTASQNQQYRGDIVIEPQIAHIRLDELGKREELIDLGEQAALEMIDEIKAMIER
jgi:NTE family protein